MVDREVALEVVEVVEADVAVVEEDAELAELAEEDAEVVISELVDPVVVELEGDEPPERAT